MVVVKMALTCKSEVSLTGNSSLVISSLLDFCQPPIDGFSVQEVSVGKAQDESPVEEEEKDGQNEIAQLECKAIWTHDDDDGDILLYVDRPIPSEVNK